MSENKNTQMVPARGGVLNELTLRIKLIWRLVSDSRVSPILKMLPIGTLLYFIIPDIAPGPIDDAAIVWLGSYLFVELCPPEVVQEHMANLNLISVGQQPDPLATEDVVDAEYWEEK